ncbi:MAG: hypothetical protein K0U98_03900 [Deltaproteobacteria bacterium]|nr:hypothetical protein [Deltaproteobacteria bacterium]
MTRFVVAMGCEARPVIARYGLKSVADDLPFPVFRKEDRWLVVSGIGRVNSAAATAFLFQLSGGRRNCGWINFGCCGHASWPVGEVLLAHKLVDASNDRSWFPPLAFSAPCRTSTVCTVDRPERRYAVDQGYEMESVGFFAAASRFATAELVHCLKVVSDGPGDRLEQLTAAKITSLLEAHGDTLGTLVTANEALAAELLSAHGVPAELSEILERWHFTVAQERQLRRLLQRWEVLSGGQGVLQNLPEVGSSSKEVLVYLKRQVAREAEKKGLGEDSIEQPAQPGREGE